MQGKADSSELLRGSLGGQNRARIESPLVAKSGRIRSVSCNSPGQVSKVLALLMSVFGVLTSFGVTCWSAPFVR